MFSEAPKDVKSTELEVNHHIVVATTTFYPAWEEESLETNADQIRGDLAIEALKTAVGKGHQVAVVDGGSSQEFINALSGYGINVIHQEEKGMSASRRQVLHSASLRSDCQAICWTEPEKISMIQNLQNAGRLVISREADIVIPCRTKESYATYPEQQAKSEQRANHFFNLVLREINLLPENSSDLDVFFGPRILRNDPEILALFTTKYRLKDKSKLEGTVKPDNYLNATFFPIIAALKKGKKVVGVPVDYVHPTIQTAFETGNPEFENKRLSQKIDIVRGTVQFARLLIDNHQKPSELLATVVGSPIR